MRKAFTPSYRRQPRPSGDRAFVELDGTRHYLGIYDSPESRERYHRLLAEWTASGGHLHVDREEITVIELVARFWSHAEGYYRRPDGSPSHELGHYRRLLKTVKDLYGETKAADFGPRALKAIRQLLVDRGLCRSTVNQDVHRLRRLFRWAVAEELLPPAVLQALQAVAGLKRGRSEAREPEVVRPAPQEHVDAIEHHVSRQVWTLIQLQLLTGARSGELVIMRACDLDMSGSIWTFSPAEHKTAHHGHERRIFLGPKAQAVVRPFLGDRPLDACLFSPKEAEAERRAAMSERRVTPLSCGNSPGTNRKRRPRRTAKDRYDVGSYGHAIRRACKSAGVPHWFPHQLRHSAATHLRKEFGIDVARIILGHRSPAITEVYAELDRSKALEVMTKIG